MGSNVRRRLPVTAGGQPDKDARRGRLREECLQRVQQQRSALLAHLRQMGGGGGGHAAGVQSVLASIIADVDSSCHSASPKAPAEAGLVQLPADDMDIGTGMHEQLPPPAVARRHWPGATAAGFPSDDYWRGPLAGMQPAGGGGWGGASGGGQGGQGRQGAGSCPEPGSPGYAELMAEMEARLWEGVRADEAAHLAALEAAEAHERDVDVAALVGSMMEQLEAGHGCGAAGIPCPVCRQGRLAECAGVVLCSRGDLRLDLRTEGLTLEDVRQRLANVLEAHALQCCAGHPLFAVVDTGGVAMLLMSCSVCSALQVVV